METRQIYRHTQYGRFLPGIVVLAMALLGWLMASIGPNPVGIGVIVLLALCVVEFHSLTVIVDSDAVRVHFGLGVFNRVFPLSEIRDVMTDRMHVYDGWGVHLTRHGWYYNVSGLNAVVLQFANGGTAAIGTDEPRALADAIESQLKAGQA